MLDPQKSPGARNDPADRRWYCTGVVIGTAVLLLVVFALLAVVLVFGFLAF